MARASKEIKAVEDALPLDFAPRGLKGKKADEPTVVRWVADNVDVADPDPATCPSPFAWTLLRTCRSNPAFVPFFVEKLWAKLIPARSQLEQTVAKAQDGKSTIELCDRILEHSRAAHGREDEPTQPPLASPPEPAPGSSFEDFDPNKEDAT